MKRELFLFPEEWLKEIEAYQKRKRFASKAEAMRQLLRAGLDAEKDKGKGRRLTKGQADKLDKLSSATKADDLDTALERAIVAFITADEDEPQPKPKTMSERFVSMVKKKP